MVAILKLCPDLDSSKGSKRHIKELVDNILLQFGGDSFVVKTAEGADDWHFQLQLAAVLQQLPAAKQAVKRLLPAFAHKPLNPPEVDEHTEDGSRSSSSTPVDQQQESAVLTQPAAESSTSSTMVVNTSTSSRGTSSASSSSSSSTSNASSISSSSTSTSTAGPKPSTPTGSEAATVAGKVAVKAPTPAASKGAGPVSMTAVPAARSTSTAALAYISRPAEAAHWPKLGPLANLAFAGELPGLGALEVRENSAGHLLGM